MATAPGSQDIPEHASSSPRLSPESPELHLPVQSVATQTEQAEPQNTAEEPNNVARTSTSLPRHRTVPVQRARPDPMNSPFAMRIIRIVNHPTYQLYGRTFFFLAQVAVVVPVLILSSQTRSPLTPNKTQWDSCDKPLGPWCVGWLCISLLRLLLEAWAYLRASRAAQMDQARHDVERPAPVDGQSTTITPVFPRRLPSETSLGVLNTLYATLSLFVPVIAFGWFISALIFVDTSGQATHNCQLAAPILWSLALALVFVVYLRLFTFFAVTMVYIFSFPAARARLSVVLNILAPTPMLSSFGPRPVKLTQAMVDTIPLVLYIPAPEKDKVAINDEIALPASAHVSPNNYPPKLPVVSTSSRKFMFFNVRRNSRRKSRPDTEKAITPIVEDTIYETSDGLPFVQLEGNRAACAICLSDFQAPQIKGVEGEVGLDAVSTVKGEEETATEIIAVEPLPPVPNSNQEEANNPASELRLDDAGEGPQPLRLLGCGHVFHRTCLDPWLLTVSGLCPMCRVEVELPK